LGSIFDNKVLLLEIGTKAKEYWSEIPVHFPHVKLNEFIVMPNRIHGLLILDYSISEPYHLRYKFNKNKFSQPIKNSVAIIINQYKSAVKRWCNQNDFGFFRWQAKFYDEIVRNDIAFENIKAYIRNNPYKWDEDENFV
jgi:REP element-mobilizing transposase RayT